MDHSGASTSALSQEKVGRDSKVALTLAMASTGRTDKRQVADLHKDKISEIYPSPSPFVVCKSKLLAADSESLETEETPAVVSEPYIAFPGRFIYTQRLKGANVDDKYYWLALEQKAYIGQPAVSNAAVRAVVEEQGLDRKVIVFKYKKKKSYRRTIGHRQIPHCTKLTWITITSVTGHQDFPAETMPDRSSCISPCMASSGEFGLTVTCSLRNPR
ncbi:hypothetical protein C4D60_Mb05t10920 [Musa balbisiana]|uniref:Ribosomal protein L21 n=1 Tax=Musa balbisiana TaxID=52838 RepID=A0A4S8JV98_MUSBA|nr:hypothetical protein C4D60_Mb05t10920 [Musa balbisiana]